MKRTYPKPVPELDIEPAIRGLITVGTVSARPVHVGPAAAGLTAEIAALSATLAARYAGRPPSEIEGLAPARRLYRTFGIDPTSTRPSSEALVRRILQGKPFPAVNAAVDVCNLCSASFLLPIGLYDEGKIRGTVTLRRGAPGESYPGIRKDAVNISGRPVLTDEAGPFGNPTSDSLRTCVNGETTALWMVIFAPADYPPDRLQGHVTFARGALERHLSPGNHPSADA
jgi:DNA/RNA-binding domain of Phe-tRNA-synthetase-like protein